MPRLPAVLLVRLNDSATVQDVVAYVDQMETGTVAGPPPATPMHGVAGMEPGGRNWIMVTLTPGEYGLPCFVPGSGDGQMHTHHGMARQFSIQGFPEEIHTNAARGRRRCAGPCASGPRWALSTRCPPRRGSGEGLAPPTITIENP